MGRIAGAFGLRGEVKVVANDPSDVRAGLTVVALLPDGSQRELTIRTVREQKRRLLVRFAGIDGADQAAALRGSTVLALVADLPPLPAGTYRDEDLIGMRVVDARLGPLGVVTAVAHYPHADMLVVGERSLLIPMLVAYSMKVDEPARTISTSLPDGFEDL